MFDSTVWFNLRDELKINLTINKRYHKQAQNMEIIKAVYDGYEMKEEYKVGKYRIDLYFVDHKIAVECDEYGHVDRNSDYEKKREKYLIKKLGCTFIRFNPDEDNFNIGNVIKKINKMIYNL